MTFVNSAEPPATPERGAVWRRPDRQWFAWDDVRLEWRRLVHWVQR